MAESDLSAQRPVRHVPDWATRWLLRLATFAVLALGWQLVSVRIGGLLVPTSTDIANALLTEVRSAEVWEAFLKSNQALVLGFLAAVVTGVPLGFFMGRFHIAGAIFRPYVRILLVAPLAGFIPVLTLTVGLGLLSRVIIVWSFAVVMVIVNCEAGVRQVPPGLIDMTRVFGAGELQVWRRVILPGAMPAVVVGLRIALGRAVTGMVIVELLMVSVGIGGLILKYQSFYQAGELYAVVVLVVAEAIGLIWLFDRLQHYLLPWKRSQPDALVPS